VGTKQCNRFVLQLNLSSLYSNTFVLRNSFTPQHLSSTRQCRPSVFVCFTSKLLY